MIMDHWRYILRTRGILTTCLFIFALSSGCTFFPLPLNNSTTPMVYANTHGIIELYSKEDQVNVVFKNNKEEQFDTLIPLQKGQALTNTAIFSTINTNHIRITSTQLNVKKLAGIQQLFSAHTSELLFYRINVPIKIKGTVKFQKGGPTIKDIYLDSFPKERGLITVEGTVCRELYPLAYYSTPESPQGCFAGDSISNPQFRLILRNYKVLSD